MSVLNQTIEDQPERPCKAHSKNFETLQRAFKNGDVCLLECTMKSTGERVATICAVTFDGSEYQFAPFAVMLNGNPYEMLTPPEA